MQAHDRTDVLQKRFLKVFRVLIAGMLFETSVEATMERGEILTTYEDTGFEFIDRSLMNNVQLHKLPSVPDILENLKKNAKAVLGSSYGKNDADVALFQIKTMLGVAWVSLHQKREEYRQRYPLPTNFEYLEEMIRQLSAIREEAVCVHKSIQEAKTREGTRSLTVHAFHTNGKERDGEEKGVITDLLKRIASLEIGDEPAVEQKVLP